MEKTGVLELNPHWMNHFTDFCQIDHLQRPGMLPTIPKPRICEKELS